MKIDEIQLQSEAMPSSDGRRGGNEAQGGIMSPDAALLDELVRRIVESVHPLQITLFGSAARGEMGPNSDLDVLVVMPDGCDRLAVTQELHCRLGDLGMAKDIVVVQASDVVEHGRNPYLIIHRALLEGRELYRAASYPGLTAPATEANYNDAIKIAQDVVNWAKSVIPGTS